MLNKNIKLTIWIVSSFCLFIIAIFIVAQIALGIASRHENVDKYGINANDTLINVKKGLSSSTTFGKVYLKSNQNNYLLLNYNDAGILLDINITISKGNITFYSPNDIKKWLTIDSIPGYSIHIINKRITQINNQDTNFIRIY